VFVDAVEADFAEFADVDVLGQFGQFFLRTVATFIVGLGFFVEFELVGADVFEDVVFIVVGEIFVGGVRVVVGAVVF
jgi:hypothetical protein